MTSKIKVDTIEEKTSANGVVIDSVTLKDGGVTATAASTITVTDNSDTLSLISTDADANVGPVLRLYRNSASAVDNDVIGNLIFSGNDTAGNETDYLTFQVNAGDADDGQEDGFMRILMPVASSSTEFVRFSPATVVFNEGSADLDFRVESDGNQNMFVVDASTNKVHVGCNADTSSKGILIVEGAGTTGSSACYGLIRGAHEGTIGLSSIGGLTLKSFSSEVLAQDSAGNSTVISPHNFEMIPDGASEELAWAYYSRRGDEEDYNNTKYVNVDLAKVVRTVENISGEKLIYTGTGDTDDGSTVTENRLKALEDRIKALEDAE